jgi:hypothetical protein
MRHGSKSQYLSASTLLTLPVRFYTASVTVASERLRILSAGGRFPNVFALFGSLRASLLWLVDWLCHVMPAERPIHLNNSVSLHSQIPFIEPSAPQSCVSCVEISTDLNGLFRALAIPFQHAPTSNAISR